VVWVPAFAGTTQGVPPARERDTQARRPGRAKRDPGPRIPGGHESAQRYRFLLSQERRRECRRRGSATLKRVVPGERSESRDPESRADMRARSGIGSCFRRNDAESTARVGATLKRVVPGERGETRDPESRAEMRARCGMGSCFRRNDAGSAARVGATLKRVVPAERSEEPGPRIPGRYESAQRHGFLLSQERRGGCGFRRGDP
jgi:hypothetical protein